MDPETRGWVVTIAGAGINLALGVLYSWSVVADSLARPLSSGGAHGWSTFQTAVPFAVALAAFAVTMVFAGQLQDRVGPRWVATAGGVMVGGGLVVASLSPARLAPGAIPVPMTLGFGLMTGTGIGLAYASVTPAAVKWFAPRHRGLVVGVVVAGFGFSPIITAPVALSFINAFGVDRALLYLGIGLLALIVGLAQLVSDPLPGFVAPGSYAEPPGVGERTSRAMLRTRGFYALWLAFALSSFAGLGAVSVLTASVARLGDVSAVAGAAALIGTIALGNGLGRVAAGLVSDRIGWRRTLLGVLLVEAASLLTAALVGGFVPVLAAAGMVGLTYGGTLALFPAATFDYFGTRHAGANYGLVFTAWGAGGVAGWTMASRLAGATSARPGLLLSVFALCAACALGAAVVLSVAKAPAVLPRASRSARRAPVGHG